MSTNLYRAIARYLAHPHSTAQDQGQFFYSGVRPQATFVSTDPAVSASTQGVAPLSRGEFSWCVVEWSLFAIWTTDAALVMTHQHAGLFTSFASDLTLPAWLYVVFRRKRNSFASRWRRALGNSPPSALAGIFFVASAATEVSQRFWPHGIFSGTFDLLDIVAYGLGLGLCWVADSRWQIPSRPA